MGDSLGTGRNKPAYAFTNCEIWGWQPEELRCDSCLYVWSKGLAAEKIPETGSESLGMVA